MKFVGHLSVGLVGCGRVFGFEVPDDELEGLGEIEREDAINTAATEVMWEYVEMWEEEA